MNDISSTVFDLLAPVTLDELDAIASLQTRVDRKYLVPADVAAQLVDRLSEAPRVLEIAGVRCFGYRSIYFDTAGYDCFLTSARRRQHRMKVRTRTYLDSGDCVIEVKLRDRQQRTVKHRTRHDAAQPDQITPDAARFLDEFDGLLPPPNSLRPTLATRYRRTTLLCGSARATFDLDVACVEPGSSRRATVADRVVVETKGVMSPSEFDRLLWRAGARPVTISKYGTGLAALRPNLPANKWHRVLQRHIAVTPDTFGVPQ